MGINAQMDGVNLDFVKITTFFGATIEAKLHLDTHIKKLTSGISSAAYELKNHSLILKQLENLI